MFEMITNNIRRQFELSRIFVYLNIRGPIKQPKSVVSPQPMARVGSKTRKENFRRGMSRVVAALFFGGLEIGGNAIVVATDAPKCAFRSIASVSRSRCFVPYA